MPFGSVTADQAIVNGTVTWAPLAGDSPVGAAGAARATSSPNSDNTSGTLVRLAENFSPQPLLATSWELVGAHTFRFHLRDGVTFWDGSKMTADDVKWSLDRTAKGQIGYSYVGEGSTRVVDPLT